MRRFIPCVAILAASIAFEGCSHFQCRSHKVCATPCAGMSDCGCEAAMPESVVMPPGGGYVVPGVTAVPQAFTTRGSTSSLVR